MLKPLHCFLTFTLVFFLFQTRGIGQTFPFLAAGFDSHVLKGGLQSIAQSQGG